MGKVYVWLRFSFLMSGVIQIQFALGQLLWLSDTTFY